MKYVIPLILICGCSLPHVPATTVKFDALNGALSIASPKDVTVDSVSINKSSNGFTMTVVGYKSTNNAALVGVVSQAQAAVASNALTTINTLGSSIAQGIIQGAK